MRAQRSGSIILTASVAGLTAWSHAAPYCATKAAVIQLAKVAAVEYARDGIRVNCVCPGTFLSGIHEGLPQEAIDAIAAKHPLGLGDADDLRGRLLVPRERRVALDDGLGDRGRRRLRRAVGRCADHRLQPGHELVRRARAPRAPHARPSRSRSSATTSSPTGMVEWAAALAGGLARARRRRRRRRRAALVQQHRVPGHDLRRQPPRRDRDADQLAARGAGAALHPRALRSARARVRRASSSTSRTRRRRDLDGDLVRVCIVERRAVAGWERFADLGADAAPPPARRSTGDDLHRLMYTSGTTGRPKGVMITHANLAWKNYAHITEFGFTAADVGLACGPLYHVGALDLVTTSMIAVGATTIIHRVFDAEQVVDEIERSRVTTRVGRARDGAGDPRRPGHRAARSLVGARDHRRRREDADPVHRAPAPHVPVGVVRRRLRPHRDGLGRHLPRPRRARSSQARQRRPAVPVPRARHLGRARRVGARGRARRGRAARPEGVRGLLARSRRHRARRSRAAGSTPATSACSTTTATSTSSTGSRT